MNNGFLMPIHLRHLSLWESTGEEPSLDAEGHEELDGRVVGVVELNDRVVVEVIVCNGSAEPTKSTGTYSGHVICSRCGSVGVDQSCMADRGISTGQTIASGSSCKVIRHRPERIV